jgi:hypothetical protein
LRSTLNARDLCPAYNVLNPYRKLVFWFIDRGRPTAAADAVRHMKYYGLVSFDMEMSFITETVAYDLAALAQHANEHKSEAEESIVSEFLELDRPPFVRGQEKALMGVRKAQVKLAAYYIMSGQEERARAIARDMRDEPPERMRIIQHQLQRVESKDFWEIIDRGSNFEYMPDEQKACLPTFFSWLDMSVDAG